MLLLTVLPLYAMVAQCMLSSYVIVSVTHWYYIKRDTLRIIQTMLHNSPAVSYTHLTLPTIYSV